MCGIGGFFVSPNSCLLKTGQISKLKVLTVELLKNLEKHGKEASGLAIVGMEGIKVYKQAVCSSKLVMAKAFNKFLDNNLDDKTISVMVHTRLPTVGSVDNNDNNHPVIHGNVVGIHNGHITNHDNLFGKLKVKRLAEVDSEVIFAMLNLAWDHEIKNVAQFRDVDYTDGVVRSTPTLSGSLAFAAVNARLLKHMAIVRSGSSCVIIKKLQKTPEGILVFATLLTAAEDAGKTAGLWGTVESGGYEYLDDNSMLHLKIDSDNKVDLAERKIL